MNTILKDVIMVASGIIGGTLFILIRNKIFKTTKQEVVKIIPDEDKAKVKELYDKGLVPEKLYKEVCLPTEPTEKFSINKFVAGMVSVGSPVGWAKDIASIFNLRKLIIIGVIIGVIFGYGYYKGRLGKEVIFDLKGKEAIIQLNEHFLKIEKDGTAKVVDKDGKILKTIKVKDIDGLRQALRPYGFKLDPIIVAGGGIGESGAGFEGGAGISWFKYFKYNLDSFLTNRGIYPLGVSYQITDNSGVGLGAGMGFKGDKRVILYYKWKF